MRYNLNDSLEWLKGLLRIRSVEDSPLPGCPFGKGVRESLDYSLSLLRKLGFVTKDLDGYCGYGEIGQGELFGILAHLDVVPEGEGWSYPPFAAVEEDGKIYARGAIDDKAPFIASLFAIVKLLQDGYIPKKRARFILGCDEESGWKCIERYKQTEEMPSLGISPDADFPVINCEKGIVYHTLEMPLPDGIAELCGGQRANMVPASAFCKVKYSQHILNNAKATGVDCQIENGYISLTAKGFSSHGSHPEKGDNALYKIFYCLKDDYEQINELYQAFHTHDGKAVGLDFRDEASGKLTLNLGICKIENKKMVCELDIRYPISYNKDEITDLLNRKLPCKAIRGLYHDPLYIDEKHPLIQTLLSSYDKVMGNKVPSKPIVIGGGTYARALPVGAAFGPLFPNMVSTMHEKDEFISLEHYEKLVEIYYQALKELCFYERK